MLATLCLLLAGCTVQVKPQVLPNVQWPWQKPAEPPKPWWKLGVEHVSLRKAKPAEAPAVEPPEPKPTAAIHWEGGRQYIVRGREKCFWSASRGAWMKPKRGACAGGVCGWEAIKPGE